jgi:hypothetical protein
VLISENFEFTYHGEDATLVVVHNDGYCWGEFETASGKRLAVVPRADYYDEPDEMAAERFIDLAMHDEECVEESNVSWNIRDE